MRPIARALVLLSLVAVGCFAAEASLPLPSRGRLIASQAMRQLSSSRPVSAVRPTKGNRVTVSCPSPRLIRRSRAAAVTRARQLEFQLASCPLALRDWVGAALARTYPVAVRIVRYAATPAYRLTFLTRPLVVVYVDRRRLNIVAVRVHSARARLGAT
jgi:hypothetical protein